MIRKIFFIIFTLIFLFIINGCKKTKVNTIKVLNENFSLNNFFSIKDSIIIDIPNKYLFSYIKDISVFKNGMYLCVASKKFPILKLENNKYIKNIGRIGQGPNEYNFPPTKISCDSTGKFFIASDGPNALNIYFYNGSKLMKKNFYKLKRIYDVELYENKIIIGLAGRAKYRIILYDTAFNLISKKIKLPKVASMLENIGTPFWTFQRNGNEIISNISYPLHIYRSIIKGNRIISKEILPNLKLKNYGEIDTTLSLDNTFKMTRKKRLRLYARMGKLFWILKNKNKYVGMYFYQDKKSKAKFNLFIVDENKKLLELPINNHKDALTLIPVGDHLINYSFIKKEERVFLKILKLKLK